MEFNVPYLTDSTGVGSSMSADHIETGTLQTVTGHLDFSQFFSEKRFMNCFAGTGSRGRRSR
jgi:hypothetical protein